MRQRLEGICATVGLRLADLDLQVITAPSIRLDVETDRDRLEQTVATLRPTMLVLDPFVRLHRKPLACALRCELLLCNPSSAAWRKV